jgi:myo-inositol-1(or 4)-monophosphatase
MTVPMKPSAFAALPEELSGLPELVDRLRHVGSEILLPGLGDARHPLVAGKHASEVDTEAETAILRAVDDLFDAPTVLSEELFHRDSRALQRDPSLRVILDPLDGTIAYNAGLPTFSISIAFELNGVVEAAVVYHPPEDRSFVAVRGAGAFVEEKPIERSGWTSRIVAVKSALHHQGRVGAVCTQLRAAGYEVQKLESSALKLCLTAEGRRAGVIKQVTRAGGELLSWGVAAGILVCQEAGVLVCDLEGRPWDEPRTSVVAGAPEIHALTRAVIEGAA